MALARIGGGAGSGVAFLVAAGIVYEIVAANCSSPQTTELNAGARAATLMKYVNLGMVQSAVFVVAAARFDPPHTVPIVAGGALAAAFMYGLYDHAKREGLASSAPVTESHPPKTMGLSWNQG